MEAGRDRPQKTAANHQSGFGCCKIFPKLLLLLVGVRFPLFDTCLLRHALVWKFCYKLAFTFEMVIGYIRAVSGKSIPSLMPKFNLGLPPIQVRVATAKSKLTPSFFLRRHVQVE